MHEDTKPLLDWSRKQDDTICHSSYKWVEGGVEEWELIWNNPRFDSFSTFAEVSYVICLYYGLPAAPIFKVVAD